MVWRKKKIGSEVADTVRGAASPSAGAVAAANSQAATSVGSSAPRPGELRPQNLDSLPGSWLFDAEEFKIPVRLQAAQRPFTIPRNYRITGDVTSGRRIIIEGELAGGALDAPTVTVTAGGCLRGRVKAVNLQVAGSVDADVVVTKALEVSGRGQLAGHIQAPQLKVWPGAVLHGAVLTVGGDTAQTAKR